MVVSTVAVICQGAGSIGRNILVSVREDDILFPGDLSNRGEVS